MKKTLYYKNFLFWLISFVMLAIVIFAAIFLWIYSSNSDTNVILLCIPTYILECFLVGYILYLLYHHHTIKKQFAMNKIYVGTLKEIKRSFRDIVITIHENEKVVLHNPFAYSSNYQEYTHVEYIELNGKYYLIDLKK